MSFSCCLVRIPQECPVDVPLFGRGSSTAIGESTPSNRNTTPCIKPIGYPHFQQSGLARNPNVPQYVDSSASTSTSTRACDREPSGLTRPAEITTHMHISEVILNTLDWTLIIITLILLGKGNKHLQKSLHWVSKLLNHNSRPCLMYKFIHLTHNSKHTPNC